MLRSLRLLTFQRYLSLISGVYKGKTIVYGDICLWW